MMEPQKLVRVEWPEMGVAIHANQLLAAFDGSTVYLTFCQTTPPVIIGTDEEKQKQLNEIDSVKAMPIARLAVPLVAFRAMVELLQQQIVTTDGKTSSDLPPADHE